MGRGAKVRRILRRPSSHPKRQANLASMISSMLSSEKKILEPFKILIEAEYVRSRLWKQHTWNRKPLDPSFKLAATLRHLDSGAKYSVLLTGRY